MELNHSGNYASRGVANGGLATGIIGTSLGALNLMGGCGGILGNLFGGWGGNRSCSFDAVTHYELAQENAIAAKDARIALLEANTYQDQKTLELYRYIDGKLSAMETEFCRLNMALQRERDERCCADNAIVNYSNNTFYPKQVADVTVGTTTTTASVYNPIPDCGCGCNR